MGCCQPSHAAPVGAPDLLPPKVHFDPALEDSGSLTALDMPCPRSDTPPEMAKAAAGAAANASTGDLGRPPSPRGFVTAEPRPDVARERAKLVVAFGLLAGIDGDPDQFTPSAPSDKVLASSARVCAAWLRALQQPSPPGTSPAP